MPGAVVAGEGPLDLGEKGAGQPDAVLVLGEPVVGARVGEGAASQEVVLVGRVDEASTERVGEAVLPGRDLVEDRGGFGGGGGAQARLGGVGADADRDDRGGGERRVAVEDPEECVVEDRAVVDAGADHDLAVDLDVGVEERGEPPQAGGAPPVPEELGPHGGVGGVDAHVERPEPFGDDPFEVGFGEAGQRREVPIEKGEPVVVVFQVEAAPHAFGQLVDEAERAVVVAGSHLVEHRGGELEAERLPRLLLDDDAAFEAAASHVELDECLVGLDLVADDVADRLAVHGEELVLREDPGLRGRRTRRDRQHPRGGHGPQFRGR